MRAKELEGRDTLKGYNPRLTLEEYEKHLDRISALASRGLQVVAKDADDPDLFYPFITIMMPVVVMADWIGNRDDMLHAYLRGIAPAIRRVASMAQSSADSVEETGLIVQEPPRA
jgi:hypothetical protein